MEGMKIVIEVEDWRAEYSRDEITVQTIEDVRALATQKGWHPAKIARMCIVLREFGGLPADIIPTNKAMLQTGAAAAVHGIINTAKQFATMPNGTQWVVRSIVLPVAIEDEDDEEEEKLEPETAKPAEIAVTLENDPQEALERATTYLLNRVPGYIMGRLKIIAAVKGDIKEAALQLHRRIDELVAELVE